MIQASRPDKRTGCHLSWQRRSQANGFTVVELLIVLAVVAVFAALLLPALSRTSARSARLNCSNNLKQIGLSAKTWGLDNGDKFPMGVSTNAGGTMEWTMTGFLSPHFQVMSNELSTPKLLVCPNDVKREAATNFSVLADENVSYFLNLDAADDAYAGILGGDGNLRNPAMTGTRIVRLQAGGTLGWSAQVHRHQGTLLFADGSVAQFANGHVPALTNSLRVAVPPRPVERR